MKNKIIIVLSLLASVMIQAQEPTQYLHFSVGGGLNNLSYTVPNGSQTARVGYTINGAYSYFFTPNWGLQAGLGIQSFGSISKLNYFTAAPAVDSEGDAFEFRTQYTNWQEKQNALFLEIPIAAQYRYTINEKFGLIGSLGVKMSLPIYTKYQTFGGQIRTTGYYEQWNVELYDLPKQGYSTITNSFTDKISLNPVFTGLVDFGGLYKLSSNLELYAGAYFNYGFNKAKTPDTKVIYQLDGAYNGMFASNQVQNVKPVSLGLKVGIYLQIGKQKPTIKIEVKEPELPVVTKKPEATKDTVAMVVQKPTTVEIPKVEVKTPEIIDTPKPIHKEVKSINSFKAAQAIATSIKIRFDENSTQPMSKINNEKFKSLIKYLKSNPKANLQIIGHTSNTGSRHNNMKLGTQRAIEIEKKLIQLGAPREQLIPLSKASDEPLVPNTNAKNRAKNCRVELNLVTKK